MSQKTYRCRFCLETCNGTAKQFEVTKKISREEFSTSPAAFFPGNRAISVLNGQKPCTRIVQVFYSLFLHFLEAKHLLQVTPKTISHGNLRK